MNMAENAAIAAAGLLSAESVGVLLFTRSRTTC